MALRPADRLRGEGQCRVGCQSANWYLVKEHCGSRFGSQEHRRHYYDYRAWGPNWPFDPAWKPGSKRWYRVADTAGWMESRDNFNAPGQEELLTSNSYALAGRSVLLLIEQ